MSGQGVLDSSPCGKVLCNSAALSISAVDNVECRHVCNTLTVLARVASRTSAMRGKRPMAPVKVRHAQSNYPCSCGLAFQLSSGLCLGFSGPPHHLPHRCE